MELVAEALSYFAGRASPTVSHTMTLELTRARVSKGRGVAWLAHRAGIPLGQVLAMGDALNDLEMVADAGHGVAMPTAPAEVRLAARYIAPPVGEGGAAAMIEALVLAPPEEARRNGERLAAQAREIQTALREAGADAAPWGNAAVPGDPSEAPDGAHPAGPSGRPDRSDVGDADAVPAGSRGARAR